jgi:hypothetical protein
MLHAGSNAATRDEVFAAPTPEPTESHFPVPHGALIETVERNIRDSGFEITREEYGLYKNGDRMFGVLALQNGNRADDFQLAVGIRNSHDKKFAAGLAVGTRVFVCDNLAFSSEIVIARRHTRFIMDDLDRMVADAAGKIGAAHISQEARIEAYKATELDDARVHDILIRSLDAKIVPTTYLPRILNEWREPEHDDFRPRTAWSLFNGYTEVMKRVNPMDLPKRTTRLHGLMDLETDAFGTDAATPSFGDAIGMIGA